MKDFVQLYTELLVIVDPTIYLTEIQERLASDLGLQNDEVPSTATISRIFLSQNITRKKCKKVALERFTPENIAHRRAFIQWRSSVDPRIIFVVDETGIEDFVSQKFWEKPFWYSCSTINSENARTEVVHVGSCWILRSSPGNPFDGNCTSEMFEHVIRHIVLPSLLRDSYVMRDNASIHNDNRLANILQAQNITLVKLPMYSYDLSPIEMVFSVLKAYILRDKSNGTKPVKILKAFNQVSPIAVQNFHR